VKARQATAFLVPSMIVFVYMMYLSPLICLSLDQSFSVKKILLDSANIIHFQD